MGVRIGLIIPARNEEEALPEVLGALPPLEGLDVVVVDNGSTDDTVKVARALGFKVISEETPGYGRACLRGIEYFLDRGPEVIAFMDGDFSDYPEELASIVGPVLNGSHDLVIGSRMIKKSSKKVLPIHARLGNRLSVFLIRVLFGFRYTDLGPMRAVRFDRLKDLGMEDMDYGWTVEMQIKAVVRGLRIKEVPVRYRQRIGTSKISGTVTGSFRAGAKIIKTIFRLYLSEAPPEGRGFTSSGGSTP